MRDLRGDVDTLAKLEPGSVVLHDDVHSKAGLVFSFAASMASSVGIRQTEPGPVPDRNQPHLTHQELVTRIEPIAVNTSSASGTGLESALEQWEAASRPATATVVARDRHGRRHGS